MQFDATSTGTDLPLAQVTRYMVYRRHGQDSGLVPMAPANDGSFAPAQMVRLHAPCETLIVHWYAEGVGGLPMIPHPTQLDKNQVFLNGWRGAPNPKLAGNGVHNYVIEGMYIYQVVTPIGLDSDFKTGKDPFDPKGRPSDYTIPKELFTEYILEDKVPLGNIIPRFP